MIYIFIKFLQKIYKKMIYILLKLITYKDIIN
jgi:hypothetical protein